MTTLNSYAPGNGRWTDANGKLTASAQIWLRDLWLRTGGESALTTAELEALIAAAQADADTAQAAAIAAQTDADTAQASATQAQSEVDALEIVVGALSSSGHAIEDEGTPLTQRATLNFTGAGVSVADAGGKTVVTVSGGGGGGSGTSYFPGGWG